jgi:hypothetical protein
VAKKDQATQVEDQVEQIEEQSGDVNQEAPQVEQAEPEVQRAPTNDTVYVTVTVPKAFKLRTTHDHVVDYAAGICEMPLEHAEHWYSVANGVTIYKK